MESLKDYIKTYGLSEGVMHYLTTIGKIMSRLDFRNKAVVLERLASGPIELYRAIDALKLVPGFKPEYMEREAA